MQRFIFWITDHRPWTDTGVNSCRDSLHWRAKPPSPFRFTSMCDHIGTTRPRVRFEENGGENGGVNGGGNEGEIEEEIEEDWGKVGMLFCELVVACELVELVVFCDSEVLFE